jgi:hypothetical protein
MGPGATKVNFFEAPSVGDGEHHLLTTGPFQIGMSCRGAGSGEGAIELTLYITIPGPTLTGSTLSDEEPSYESITGSVTDLPEERKVAEKSSYGFSSTSILAGADNVPHWLMLGYGAETGEPSTGTEGLVADHPRGCWLLAEEI